MKIAGGEKKKNKSKIYKLVSNHFFHPDAKKVQE